jgi:hypothetical protein
MLVSFQVAGEAGNPLNVTLFPVELELKLVPVSVIEAPTGPELAESPAMNGVTTKDAPLLAIPFTVTTAPAFPAGTVAGTGTAIAVSLQELGFAVIPPIVTGLKFCEAPKPLPVKVIALLTGLEGGEMASIFGETI